MTTPLDAIPVLVPLLNPNEPEARLVNLSVQEGDYVKHGIVLCTLETTKSTVELEAESDGYIRGLRFEEGDLALAGDVFCYLANSTEWQPPVELRQNQTKIYPDTDRQSDIPAGLRITRPALDLALQAGVDLGQLPLGPLVTARTIQELAASFEINLPDEVSRTEDVIIFGGGGHGKTLIELIRAAGRYRIAGILDDGLPAGNSILGIPILGGAGLLPALHKKGLRLAANAIGGISNPGVRQQVFERLAQAGFTCPAMVHPSAVVEPSTELSEGVQVFSHAYIGSDARLGFGVIANTGVVISHDCVIEDLANLSPGALIAGGVRIGQGALVGMGVTINLGVVVGAGARIGNGATIKGDVPDGKIVRAGSIWPE